MLGGFNPLARFNEWLQEVARRHANAPLNPPPGPSPSVSMSGKHMLLLAGQQQAALAHAGDVAAHLREAVLGAERFPATAGVARQLREAEGAVRQSSGSCGAA